ncbi:peptidylprolyl isomerase [Brevibacillus fulvus]|uniref:Peptidyl-prolyl cis-trans isomerase C/foldase protein PrsA n=1 Tax=Brevibacillus fulvus TaxID=1125967 RepID=A0A939BR06_9BACL|nr:peptidylprolyl isomerase [Brevibacillus fulvus]MBM7592170.1 peptidyl-prolyl cis-trans isomerase C/foldase protein PrsA [Brevibacillus fulvus]
MNRFVAIFSTAVLTLSLLSGCGKAEDKAKPDQQPAAEQPQDNKQAAADDPLAMFPAITLPYTANENDVFSEYQGGKVTAKEFNTFLKTLNLVNPQQGSMISAADENSLKSFIREYTGTKILAAKADEKMKQDAHKLSATTFERIKGQYVQMLGNDESKFAKLLEGHGLTSDEVMAELDLINSSVAVLKKDISEDTLKQDYEKADKAEFTVASVRHILITTDNHTQEEALKLANDMVARLKKGEDFAALAKQYSEDPGSKDNGGLYENANVNQWVPEFKQAALTLPIGQISEPVKTDYGYHVMKVESRNVQTFEEVKDQLAQSELQKSYEQFMGSDLDKQITKYNVPKLNAAASK